MKVCYQNIPQQDDAKRLPWKGVYFVSPRHPNTCWEGIFLTPKINLKHPKTPCQEVFGCLGFNKFLPAVLANISCHRLTSLSFSSLASCHTSALGHALPTACTLQRLTLEECRINAEAPSLFWRKFQIFALCFFWRGGWDVGKHAERTDICIKYRCCVVFFLTFYL